MFFVIHYNYHLLIDYGHMSVFGAQMFGKKTLELLSFLKTQNLSNRD